MQKNDFEYKSLAYIILICYFFNWIFSACGFFSDDGSKAQILQYQIGNTFAISASVMVARYIGLRGQQVAASAYILMGITHGISLAALSKEGINPDRGVTMAMPMIPALIFMFWCTLYPMWLRFLSVIPCILFALVFVNVQLGESYFGLALYAGYGTLQFIEVLWGIYIYKDWQEMVLKKSR